MEEKEERLLRPKDVAKRLGIGLSTVWCWLAAGKLPKPFKIGEKTTVWKNSDITKFIESLTIPVGKTGSAK
jgi:prophage regulatory protein